MELYIFDSCMVFIIAIIYSLIEIEIEGPEGWAKHLPTTKNFLGHLTLYHFYMLLFMFCVFIFIFYPRMLVTANSKDKIDLKTIILYAVFYTFAWFLIEDFLWFVLNPGYTFKNYDGNHIPWHKSWFLGIPTQYYFGFVVIAIVLYLSKSVVLLKSLGIIILLVLATIVFAPIYHKFYTRNHPLDVLNICN